MSRKKRELVNLDRSQVTIRVYPFGGEKAMPGWIEDDWLDTRSGPPARGLRVELGPMDSANHDQEDYQKAFRCLLARGYYNIWYVNKDGSMTPVRE